MVPHAEIGMPVQSRFRGELLSTLIITEARKNPRFIAESTLLRRASA